MPVTLLHAINLTRRVTDPDRVLLDGVSLTINSGDRIGLIGPSGSGKSTLLRAVAMLDPLDAGQILFRGQLVSPQGVPKYRRQVVYLHQRPALARGTVQEALRMPFELAISDRSYCDADTQLAVAILGRDSEFLSQSTESLSGGEQQLVALARAILLDPAIVLFDEPTASLDSDARKQFESIVDRWFAQSATKAILWTSHDHAQIARMTSQQWKIEAGALEVSAR